MKNFIYYIIATLTLSLFSCVKEESEQILSENTGFGIVDVKQFERPLEDALQELEAVLDIIYPTTRASERKIIGNIESVKGRNIINSTRSEGVIDSLIPETAYYFINFENDGFAVLGADTRLEGVYIVAELGSISSGIFTYSSGDDSDEFEGVDEADLYDAE